MMMIMMRMIITIDGNKIVHASPGEGVAEAKALLQDWLVILTAHYNQYGGISSQVWPNNQYDKNSDDDTLAHRLPNK